MGPAVKIDDDLPIMGTVLGIIIGLMVGGAAGIAHIQGYL